MAARRGWWCGAGLGTMVEFTDHYCEECGVWTFYAWNPIIDSTVNHGDLNKIK